MGLITMESYFAVFKPFTYRRLKRRRTLLYCSLTAWIVSIALPNIIMFCIPRLRPLLRHTAAVYALIIFIVTIACHRLIYAYINKKPNQCSEQKKRAAKVAFQILLVFAICTTPGFTAHILNILFPDSAIIDTYVRRWCYFIMFTNGVWDTFVYGFRSSAVREKLIDVRLCRKKNRIQTTSQGT